MKVCKNILKLKLILNTQSKTSKLQQVCGHLLATTCYEQANIRMRSRGLRQLVDNKSVACCHDCQNLLSTGLLQVVSRSCNNSANDNLQRTTLPYTCYYVPSCYYGAVYVRAKRIITTFLFQTQFITLIIMMFFVTVLPATNVLYDRLVGNLLII